MSFKDKCEEYFDSSDFYEILHIKRSATAPQVKKAYHKASLLVHPDRVPEHQKLEATEKFKIISKIHSVLSDEEKRAIYDESGTFDDEFVDSLSEWINIFNSMFREVTVDEIENHKIQYLNSETELRDIKKAYVSTKGNMTKMHNAIPFLDCANEERIIAIVKKLVDAGEVEEYDGFFNESKSKKKARLQREERNTMSKEESDQFLKEWEDSRKARSTQFANHMAALEAKYCKLEKKAIKGTSNPRSPKKTVKTGRVTKKGRK